MQQSHVLRTFVAPAVDVIATLPIRPYTLFWTTNRFTVRSGNINRRIDLGIRRMSGKTPGKEKEKKPIAVPRPSSSVILISPHNQVLLLHRVKTSSSFASAHVFPGGNVSAFHDGELPDPEETSRHDDSAPYRLAAIRETFEESGIVLARTKDGRLLDVGEKERDEGRKLVHGNQVAFEEWLREKGATADVDALIPFTRWVTPTNLPKRFTTQMYIYLLPLPSSSSNNKNITTTVPKDTSTDPEDTQETVTIPTPTPDGGIEHTTARFLPPSTWLRLCQSSRIMLFPPQYLLLHLLTPFLSPHNPSKTTPLPSPETLRDQRDKLLAFVREGNWGDKCISPTVLAGEKRGDGRVVLGLDKPGPELLGCRTGEGDRVVLVEFGKGGPRRVEVGWRKDVLAESREGKL